MRMEARPPRPLHIPMTASAARPSKRWSAPETQATQYIYVGNIVQVNDPAGNWKLFTTDAFGNLVSVTEPNPN